MKNSYEKNNIEDTFHYILGGINNLIHIKYPLFMLSSIYNNFIILPISF